MANYTGVFASHNTLVAATEDKVTLTTNRADYVNISNYGTVDIKVTTNGEAVTTAQIVDCFIVKPGTSKLCYSGEGKDTVRLISTGTPAYSVEGYI